MVAGVALLAAKLRRRELLRGRHFVCRLRVPHLTEATTGREATFLQAAPFHQGALKKTVFNENDLGSYISVGPKNLVPVKSSVLQENGFTADGYAPVAPALHGAGGCLQAPDLYAILM